MSAARLLILSASGEPAEWIVASASGGVLDRGLARPGDSAPEQRLPTVALAPGHDVLVRRMVAPGRTAAQASAAAAWHLRETLGQAPERTRVVAGPPLGDGRRLVAVTASGVVEAWLACVDALGLRADVLLPDSLLLEAPNDDAPPNALRWGDRLLVRTPDHAFSAEPELCEAVLGARSPRFITDPESVDRLLVRAALQPEINLLGADPIARPGGRWRRAGVLAGLLVLSPALHLGVAGVRDELAARALESASRAALRSAYPDAPADAAPLDEIRRRAGEEAFPGGVLSAAAVLAHAIETVPSARLDSLTLDEGRVAATVSYGAPSDLEALASSLRARAVAVEIETTSDEAGRLTSDILLRSRP